MGLRGTNRGYWTATRTKALNDLRSAWDMTLQERRYLSAKLEGSRPTVELPHAVMNSLNHLINDVQTHFDHGGAEDPKSPVFENFKALLNNQNRIRRHHEAKLVNRHQEVPLIEAFEQAQA